MTTQTFQVQIDYVNLGMIGPVEVGGEVTFTPRFTSGKWSTDGQRIANAKPEKKSVTSQGGAQTFTLAHPTGWLIGFQWLVTVVIDGETIIPAVPIRIPDPGTINWLPGLLNFEPSVPGVPVTIQTVVLPSGIGDGVIVKEGAAFVSVPVSEFEGGGGGGAVESVNGETGAVTLDAAAVGALPADYAPAWGDIPDKPSTFPATAHNHSFSQVPGLNTALTNKAGTTTGVTVDMGTVRPPFGIANRIFIEVIP